VIPGKSYTPDELLGMVWKRKWVLLCCAIVGGILAYSYARVLPARYESDTLIMVAAQRMPSEYVRPTGNSRIEDRLRSIPQEIKSRVRLERIITELNLYQELRSRISMDEVIRRMRDQDIDVRLVGGDSFRVSYTSDDPRTAMLVTKRLADLFMEENLRDRKTTADDTSSFLESQLAEMEQRLEEKETRLAQYQIAHSGELPAQLPANQQILQNTQMAIQGIQTSLSSDRDRRLAIDRELNELANPEAVVTVRGGGPAPVAPVTPTVADQLEREQTTLKTLTSRYSDVHPDVIAQRQVVRDLEQQLARELSNRPAQVDAPSAPAVPSAAAVARQNRIRELRNELATTDRQIAQRQAEERRLAGTLEDTRRRIDATPIRQAELITQP
jgi:uncharacterized protein involved in exopolysaccharide biosynthesis